VKIRYVLDTHALVWSVLSPNKLGAQARRIIEAAGPGELALASASIMELGRLIDADKIDLNSCRPTDVFGDAIEYNTVLPASLEAAIKAPALALPHADPYDRLIVAEALVLGVPLITKDSNIADSGIVLVTW
jgi:PIN domain nuclease of toxin-antitoxin system